jgi:hypothetical protein
MLSWEQFVAALANAIAWPFAAIVIALIAKGPLSHLITRITEMNFGGMNAKFDAKLANATEKVFANTNAVPPIEPGAGLDLLPLAERSPRAAILEAWTRLERTLRDQVKSKNVSSTEASASLTGLLTVARREKIIDANLYESLNSLRVLRNLAVHGPTEDLSFEKAKEFLVLADAVGVLLARGRGLNPN